MGYISDFLDTDIGKRVSKLSRKAHTFNNAYCYWVDFLTQSMTHLLVIDGLPDSLKQDEIMRQLIFKGYSLFTDKADGQLRSFFANPSKPSKYYYNYWDEYTTESPTWSDKVVVADEKEGVLVRLNELKHPIWHTIHHYGIALAHTDVSYINTLINGRNKGVPCVSDNKEKDEVNRWYDKLCAGQPDVILDSDFLGVEFKGFNDTGKLEITELLECRKNLLFSFFESFGLKTAYSKRGNMTDNEVEAGDALLMHNIANMYDVISEDLARVNAKYGTNISVRLAVDNPEIIGIVKVGTEGGDSNDAEIDE